MTATTTHRTTVTVQANPEDLPPERKVATNAIRLSDVLSFVGAGAAAVSTAALLFTTMTAFSGTIGFVLVAYVLFLVYYGILVSLDETGQAVKDRIASTFIHSLAFLVVAALVFIITYTVGRGYQALLNLNFFTQDMSNAGPLDPLTQGGVLHAILGTLIEIAIALAIVIPLGITVAVYLNEMPGRFSRLVRTVVEAMTALPSIIAGLFIYATFIMIFTKQQSGLAAALAISIMMLPIIIRSADVAIRLVPGTLKEASYALGAGHWRTVWRVTLPTSLSGLTTAVILGTARGIGETSPVLLAAGFTAAVNVNPTSGPMISLPLATFEFVKSPEPNMIARGFGTALVLLGVVLIMFIVARFLGGRGPGQLSKRQMKARARQSEADVKRFAAMNAAQTAATPTVSINDMPEDPFTKKPESDSGKEA